MMLAGLPVPNDVVDELASIVRQAGADDLADRLEKALADEVKLLALTLEERALMPSALEIHRRSSPTYAPSCSPTISGGAARGSTKYAPGSP